MRFVWAAVAVAPFVAVALGMLTGRVRARSCCAVPAEEDARMRVTGDHVEEASATGPVERELHD